MRLVGHVAYIRTGEVHTVFRGETEGMRPLGRPRHRWESIIKINILEVGWGWTMNWIDLAKEWDKWQELVNAVMNFLVP
jgi:hypothetical protein